QRDLRDDGVLGERGRAHEVPERLAIPLQARRAVGQEPEPLHAADRHTTVRPRAEAVDALATLRREQGDDVVARRDESAPALTDLLADAGAFVSEHARRVARGVRTRSRVQVGMADPARREPDERLAGLRLLELDLLHGERLTELLQHGGANLHARDRT